MILETAKLTFNEHNTPESLQFGDVYFSNEGGVKETDYVFINSNNLYSRWLAHEYPSFNIAETGFGTGLNFFRTVQLFSEFRRQNPQHICNELYFCSTEKHPISLSDAKKIFDTWKVNRVFHQSFEPSSILSAQQADITNNSNTIDCAQNYCNLDIKKALDSISYIQQEFIRDYPLPLTGLHRRTFKVVQCDSMFNLTLDLWYGDAIESLSKVTLHLPQRASINAWFLDGFAPSKNKDMWNSSLYNNIARLSANDATLATFTAVGEVRRSLCDAGFEMKKQKGFGSKRDMLVGKIKKSMLNECDPYKKHISLLAKSSDNAPYYKRNTLSNNTTNTFNIVGNGISGAILAYKLTSLGCRVNLFWQATQAADGASGNPIGGFYPQLNAQHNYASQIQVYSFLYAQHFYNQLNAQSKFKHHWCGALQIGFNDRQQERLVKMHAKKLWPDELAHLIDAKKASDLANIDIPYDCLFLPSAGWISPPSLVNACLEAAKSTHLLNLYPNYKLISFDSIGTEVKCKTLLNGKQKVLSLDNLILAMGHELKQMLENVVPLRLTRGQVELVKSDPSIKPLNTLLCHKGYFTPEVDGFHALGSTYIKDDIDINVRRDETEQNFTTHLNSIEKANWKEDLANLKNQPGNSARAAIRCSSSDHLPVVGALPNERQFKLLSELYKAKSVETYPDPSDIANVFVLSALGSRGLTTAPLMAEILVCQLLKRPYPLSSELLNTLNPNRFIVRSLIRRQKWD